MCYAGKVSEISNNYFLLFPQLGSRERRERREKIHSSAYTVTLHQYEREHIYPAWKGIIKHGAKSEPGKLSSFSQVRSSLGDLQQHGFFFFYQNIWPFILKLCTCTVLIHYICYKTPKREILSSCDKQGDQMIYFPNRVSLRTKGRAINNYIETTVVNWNSPRQSWMEETSNKED